MKVKGVVIGFCAADLILLVVCAFLYLRLDRTAPVISFGENDTVYTEGMDTDLLLSGVRAVDSRDGDVSDTLLIEKISDTAKGDVIVTYAALDRSNNVAKASRIFPCEADRKPEDVQEPETDKTAPETETETDPEESMSGDDGQEADGEQGNQDRQGQEDGNAAGQEADQQQENDRQQENDGQQEAGADRNPEEVPRENAAPVLRLSRETLTVSAGAESVNWNDCIRSITDDKDSREALFSNLVMEGNVDLNTPGEYPVRIYTKDSEGLESERKTVVVRVE